MIIDKNFIDILYKANGGKIAENLYLRIKSEHDITFEKHLQPYLEMMEKRLSKTRFDDMESFLEANYSVYVEESYKMGFFDGMRFLADIIVNDN